MSTDSKRHSTQRVRGRDEPTHGRHCRCSACKQEDWTNPRLAPCGMHGASCPNVYDPWPKPSTRHSSAELHEALHIARDPLVVVNANDEDIILLARSLLGLFEQLGTLREALEEITHERFGVMPDGSTPCAFAQMALDASFPAMGGPHNSSPSPAPDDEWNSDCWKGYEGCRCRVDDAHTSSPASTSEGRE